MSDNTIPNINAVVEKLANIAVQMDVACNDISHLLQQWKAEYLKRTEDYIMSKRDFGQEEKYINALQTLGSAITKVLNAGDHYLPMYIAKGVLKANYADILEKNSEGEGYELSLIHI